jgi:hypothetical protein
MADMQMPQAGNSGPAPVPYAGGDQSPEPPDYGPSMPLADAGAGVMASLPPMSVVHESAAAHSIAAGLADAPYAPGSVSPVFTGGDADAGGTDDVSGSVQESVAASTARWHELQSDTYGLGGVVGDLMTLPPSPLDPGVGSLGVTDPMAAFYDPPREYT